MARVLDQRGDRVQRLQEARDALAALLANSIATDLRERERGSDASADDDDFVDLAQEVAIQEDREAVLDVLRRDMKAFDQAWQRPRPERTASARIAETASRQSAWSSCRKPRCASRARLAASALGSALVRAHAR